MRHHVTGGAEMAYDKESTTRGDINRVPYSSTTPIQKSEPVLPGKPVTVWDNGVAKPGYMNIDGTVTRTG